MARPPTPMPVPLADSADLAGLIGAPALAALVMAAHATPTVLIIEAPGFLADLALATVVAALLPTAATRLTDARVVTPATDNWTVDEVHELLVSPAARMPQVRNVLVAMDADRMSAACADHVLKIIEEPVAPTTFVLCVSAADALPATIRGRAGWVVRLPVTSDALAAWLVGRGLTQDLATQAVRHLSTSAALLAQLAAAPEEAAALVALAAHPPPPAHATSAARAAGILLAAVATRATEDPLFGAERSVPATRRRTRRLASAVLASWRAAGASGVDHADLSVTAQRRMASALVALDLAEQLLSRNGSVELALAVALSGGAGASSAADEVRTLALRPAP